MRPGRSCPPGRAIASGRFAAVRLRYIRAARRLWAIRPPMDPSVQILKPALEVCLVVLPRHAIHSWRRLALQPIERYPERIDIDVVEKRGEPLLLPLPCCLPYAVQRLGHAVPGLCPVRASLLRVPLGPRPWLHRLRHRCPGFVRRLHSYYGGVRLLQVVHRRLRLLTFPPRTTCPWGRVADPEISRFPCKERPYMPGSQTTPDRAGTRVDAPLRVAFRRVNGVGIRDV